MPKLEKALVEFETLESAQNLIAHCQSIPSIMIDGKPATFAYSKSQKINNPSVPRPYTAPTGSQRILHCNVQNPRYVINVRTIMRIMERFGTIQRIVIFQKSALQVLVEFEAPAAARKALEELDGKDIYPGCCKLKIEYSRQERLNVHYNNEKQYDFTVNLPSGPEELAPVGGARGQYVPGTMDLQQWGMQPYGITFYPTINQQAAAAAASVAAAAAVAAHTGGASFAQPMAVGVPVAMGVPPQMAVVPQPYRDAPQQSPVAMVYNVPAQVKPAQMFNFASLYGVVEKVRELGQERMQCQMRTPAQAKELINALNMLTVFRARIRVEASRFTAIKDSAADSDSVTDFSAAPGNRYTDGDATPMPSMKLTFRVCAACTAADIRAALKDVGAPEPSDITVEELPAKDASAKSDADAAKAAQDKDAAGDSEKAKSDGSDDNKAAAAAAKECTTGTIACTDVSTAAEIVMLANNAPVCGALLELHFVA